MCFYAAFQSGGVDVSKPIVLTCGGAMVAPFVTFALSLIGSNAPVYDVSLEWHYQYNTMRYMHNLDCIGFMGSVGKECS